MEKIRAARKTDVTTIIRFDLPFSLLRLPDGSYEMREDDYTYRFSINRIQREAETAQKLTGWTPCGDIDIIGDRFGRFSYSRVEIQIPYRIDEEMWSYFCPNCELEVDKSTTTCPICRATFSSEKSRRPPLKKVKKKAIELINKFLDAYRFFFKDYFVEHIRYNDIISFEIEYVLNDGTKASWFESFDLSVGSVVKAGTLVAKPNELESFLDVLSKLNERIALRDYLLASAENSISTEEYHLAILESVIALEITLSGYILGETKKLGIPKKEANDLIRNIGLYGNLRAILKLLTKDKEQTSDTVYQGCEETIQKRNKIAHRGETAVTYNEAKKGIWNIKKMTDYITKLSS